MTDVKAVQARLGDLLIRRGNKRVTDPQVIRTLDAQIADARQELREAQRKTV